MHTRTAQKTSRDATKNPETWRRSRNWAPGNEATRARRRTRASRDKGPHGQAQRTTKEKRSNKRRYYSHTRTHTPPFRRPPRPGFRRSPPSPGREAAPRAASAPPRDGGPRGRRRAPAPQRPLLRSVRPVRKKRKKAKGGEERDGEECQEPRTAVVFPENTLILSQIPALRTTVFLEPGCPGGQLGG